MRNKSNHLDRKPTKKKRQEKRKNPTPFSSFFSVATYILLFSSLDAYDRIELNAKSSNHPRWKNECLLVESDEQEKRKKERVFDVSPETDKLSPSSRLLTVHKKYKLLIRLSVLVSSWWIKIALNTFISSLATESAHHSSIRPNGFQWQRDLIE